MRARSWMGVLLLTACSGNNAHDMAITRGTASRTDAAVDAEEPEPELDATEAAEAETPPPGDAGPTLDASSGADGAASDAGSLGDASAALNDAGMDAASALDATESASDAGTADAATLDAATPDADSGEMDALAQADAQTDADSDVHDSAAPDAEAATLEAATPVLIDFEDLTGMGNSLVAVPLASQLSDHYLPLGAVFNGDDTFVGVVNLGAGHATSGRNGIGSSSATGALSYSAPVRVAFLSPTDRSLKATTSFVRIRGDTNAASGVATLVAYDVTETEIGRVSATDVSGGLRLELAVPHIHRIVITQTQANIAFDDLSFAPVTVE